MKICGSNRWWLDDAKLIIRRVRGPKEIVTGVCSLLIAAAVGLVLAKMGKGWELRGWAIMVTAFGYGLYSALGAWEVTLNRVSGRISWRWGIGVPLFEQGRVLTESDHVRLDSLGGATTQHGRLKAHSVRIAGAGEPKLLAGSDDYAEALALAEAVAHHTRLGLQVDSGRVRSVSAGPQGASGGSLSAGKGATAGAPLARPPDVRVQVRSENGQRTVELPALGWAGGYLLQAIVGSVLVLGSVGLCGVVLWLGMPAGPIAILALLMVMLSGVGGSLFWRALVGARTSWSITVSRRGLEVVRFRARSPSTTRVAVHLVRDIDVRDLRDGGMQVGVVGHPTFPTLVIERTEGEALTLRAGLSRKELEWAATWLREELREKTEGRIQQSG